MKHSSPQMIKDSLLSIITNMRSQSDLFVKRPGKDFTRERKLYGFDLAIAYNPKV